MTHQNVELDKRAQDNLRQWLLNEHLQQRLESKEFDKHIGPFVVISRETGAGGSAIAHQVGKKLGWAVLDDEILDYMAEKYHDRRHMLQLVDEKYVSGFSDLLNTWLVGEGYTSQTAYVHRLGKFLYLAAHHGEVVFVGRGAPFLLPREKGILVRILAPVDFRVEQVVLQKGLSVEDAKKYVDDSDRNLQQYIQQYHFHKVTDPHLYDLVLNVEKLGQGDIADIIVAATRSWLKKPRFSAGTSS